MWGFEDGGELKPLPRNRVRALAAQRRLQAWQQRLEPDGDRGGSWSSVLLAGGNLYVPSQSGGVFVLPAAAPIELLATNSVEERTNASLAASGGEPFLRTDEGLWCAADAKCEPPATASELGRHASAGAALRAAARLGCGRAEMFLADARTGGGAYRVSAWWDHRW